MRLPCSRSHISVGQRIRPDLRLWPAKTFPSNAPKDSTYLYSYSPYFLMSHDSDYYCCATKNIRCSPTLPLCKRDLPRPDAVRAVVIDPQLRSWILHFPRGLLSPRVGCRGRLRHLGGLLHCLCYRKAGFSTRCSSSLNDKPRDFGAQT